MAKVSHNLSDLKSLLGEDVSDISNSCVRNNANIEKQRKVVSVQSPITDDSILHSYITCVVRDSEVYEIMKDTEAEGKSFMNLAESYNDQLSKDIVEYFACCFYEGDYSTLDTIATHCEAGYNDDPCANANILGHTVSITYEDEFGLLANLFAIALAIDQRMDDEQEEIQFTYNPTATSNVQSGVKADKETSSLSLVYVSGNKKLNLPSDDKRTSKSSIHKRSSYSKKTQTDVSAGLKPKSESKATLPKTKPQSVPRYQAKPGGYWENLGGNVGYHRRRSFAAHIANSGVWGKIADYGGHGRLIYINAGHSR